MARRENAREKNGERVTIQTLSEKGVSFNILNIVKNSIRTIRFSEPNK